MEDQEGEYLLTVSKQCQQAVDIIGVGVQGHGTRLLEDGKESGVHGLRRHDDGSNVRSLRTEYQ
jgi:hypothetical protein